MIGIHDLVQEFWRTSIDGADGEPIYAMSRLHKILGLCLEVCFLATVNLPDKTSMLTNPDF